MLLRKHQYMALVSGSLSVLALVNCSDNDTLIGGGGGSGAGKAGATESGAGAGGKVNPSGGKGGASSHAGDGSETAGDSSEGGKPGAGAGNMSDAGEGGMEDNGGAIGTAGKGGTGGMAGKGGSAGMAGTAGNGGSAGATSTGGTGGTGGAAGAGGQTSGMAGAGGQTSHVGPILKYTFDEGTGLVAADSSGNGFNGALTAATWTAQGRTGAGLALTGGVPATNYVTVPKGVFKGVTATTIATWLKLTADVPWARIFDFSNAGTGTDARFMYLTTNTQYGVHFSTFGGAVTREAVVDSATIFPLAVWKHLAVTIADGGKRSMYIDGFPAAEATTFDVPPSELEPLSAASYLGKSRFDVDAGFNGTLDDFSVYDRVLSANEIATLATPQGDYTRIPFDEGTGTTSADVSTRGVTATLTDATWASGRLGAAVKLSGAAQYVTLANPLAGCTDTFTISLWVNEVTEAAWARILDFGGTSDNFMFLTPKNGAGKLQLSIHTGTGETVITSATTVPPDSLWHHVAVVVSPTVASVFVDGNVVGNAPNPELLGVTNEHWLGKSRFVATDPYFTGSFDEVRIACRAYTSDEIKSLAFH